MRGIVMDQASSHCGPLLQRFSGPSSRSIIIGNTQPTGSPVLRFRSSRRRDGAEGGREDPATSPIATILDLATSTYLHVKFLLSGGGADGRPKVPSLPAPLLPSPGPRLTSEGGSRISFARSTLTAARQVLGMECTSAAAWRLPTMASKRAIAPRRQQLGHVLCFLHGPTPRLQATDRVKLFPCPGCSGRSSNGQKARRFACFSLFNVTQGYSSPFNTMLLRLD